MQSAVQKKGERMRPNYWANSWDQGGIKTCFHIPHVHPFIPKHITPDYLRDKHVLVPLCGKSVDLFYFSKYARSVTGIELVKKAVEQFFDDNQISAKRVGDVYRYNNIEIINRDIFTIEKRNLADISVIYDRASLIAFPPDMRAGYIQKMKELLPVGGSQFINTLEYGPHRDGPPFSVSPDDITDYYGASHKISQLERKNHTDHELMRHWDLDFIIENLFHLKRIAIK